jgi:tyrosyl-tRNA synthetase
MAPPTDPEAQVAYLTRNAADVISPEELQDKIARRTAGGGGLRVKLGLDPTAGEVTLGWAVVLRKLREYQDLGHTAVLIVGDFTARVGDPSGKSDTRPRLSKETVQANADRVLGQFEKILSTDRLEIRYNSEWLDAMGMEDVLRLSSAYTVARMLERDDFAKRYAEGRPISVMEFLYPLFQAMDSVAVQADVELGGNDQLFNLLVGRQIQREYGQESQVVFTMPLLVGLDGERVMGQSLGNFVGIREAPEEMFGKLMSLPDTLTVHYLRLATGLPTEDIEAVEKGLADGSVHPNAAKRRMAREIVAQYHGTEGGGHAEEAFDRVHRERELPEQIEARTVRREALTLDRGANGTAVYYPALLVELGLAETRSEARRLIEQGAVRRDGVPWTQVEQPFTAPGEGLVGSVWQVGRRGFARVAGLL